MSLPELIQKHSLWIKLTTVVILLTIGSINVILLAEEFLFVMGIRPGTLVAIVNIAWILFFIVFSAWMRSWIVFIGVLFGITSTLLYFIPAKALPDHANIAGMLITNALLALGLYVKSARENKNRVFYIMAMLWLLLSQLVFLGLNYFLIYPNLDSHTLARDSHLQFQIYYIADSLIPGYYCQFY